MVGALVALAALPAVSMTGKAARDVLKPIRAEAAELNMPELPQRSTILDADGSKVATFFYQNRVAVPLDEVAPVARKALIAIEDARFFQHEGVDAQGMLRALVANLRTGRLRQGGSTLTQQYVENVRLLKADSAEERRAAHAQTIAGKLREIRYALAVDEKLSKKEILERYLNIAYFGDGAYGIEAAARHYFDKQAAALTLSEGALLAGLVKAPSSYNPVANPARAKRRRDAVLARMAELGMINRERLREISGSPLGLDVQPIAQGCKDSDVPSFCTYVIEEIKNSSAFGETRAKRARLLNRGGLTIHTTLKPETQRAAKQALTESVPPGNASNKAAAEVMVEPGTGKIRAMAASIPFGTGKNETRINLAANKAHGGSNGFQAGSTFKAFTLATALSQRKTFNYSLPAPYRATVTGYEDCKGNTFSPYTLTNAISGESGTFNLRTGTWKSVNVFFAKLEKKVGLCDAVKTARSMGLRKANGEPIPVVPSFTLGTATVAPLNMANAFATFAARGVRCDPIAITKVVDRNGKPLDVPDAECNRVMPKGVADGVSHILQGVLDKGTAAGADISRPAAGKTGTVDSYAAAWFVGYTPKLASAVWVGDPRGGRNHPLRNITIGGEYYDKIYGATLPAPIWQTSMTKALQGVPPGSFPRPPEWMFGTGTPSPKQTSTPSPTPTRQSPSLLPAPSPPQPGPTLSEPVPEEPLPEPQPPPGDTQPLPPGPLPGEFPTPGDGEFSTPDEPPTATNSPTTSGDTESPASDQPPTGGTSSPPRPE